MYAGFTPGRGSSYRSLPLGAFCVDRSRCGRCHHFRLDASPPSGCQSVGESSARYQQRLFGWDHSTTDRLTAGDGGSPCRRSAACRLPGVRVECTSLGQRVSAATIAPIGLSMRTAELAPGSILQQMYLDERLARRAGTPGTFIDLGAGTGGTSSVLLARGWRGSGA